jgi:hypothetical protein
MAAPAQPNAQQKGLSRDDMLALFDAACEKLDAGVPKEAAREEIDLWLDSGGFRGWFLCFLVHYFQRSRRWQVKRVAGASAGAAAAVGLFCNLDMAQYACTYHERYQVQVVKFGRSIIDVFDEIVRELLPADAAQLCQGRLYLSANEVLPFSRSTWRTGGLRFINFDEFPSLEDLIDIMTSSMTVSKITSAKNSHKYKGKTLVDGVKPFLPADGANRRQLFVDLHRVQYPGAWIMAPHDPDITHLIKRSIADFTTFLEREINTALGPHRNSDQNQLPIYWIPVSAGHKPPANAETCRGEPLAVLCIAAAAASSASEPVSALDVALHSSASMSTAAQFTGVRAEVEAQDVLTAIGMPTSSSAFEMPRGQQRLLRSIHTAGSLWDRISQKRDELSEHPVVGRIFRPFTRS